MGSLLISLHFTVLPPLGWAIYHSTCTYTHRHAQTNALEQCTPQAWVYTPFRRSVPNNLQPLYYVCVLYTHTHTQRQKNRINWTHGLCKMLTTQLIYVVCRLNLIQNLSLHFPHIFACTCAFSADTNTHTFMHVFMSPAERNTAAALMWQQAMAQKTSKLMKVASLRELFLRLSTRSTMRQNTHYEGTRVQVNIHVIAMKQLLGKIRSVITGLKIKWEFFISAATCYSTNRAARGTLMRVDSRQMVGTTTENFSFKT